MFKFSPALWLAAAVLLPPLTALAQDAPPALSYRSALEGYQPFADEELRPWKDSNATVQQIGGWRAYAKEAGEPTGKNIPALAAPVAAQPHADHGKPGGKK